jgi:hypothetical protein
MLTLVLALLIGVVGGAVAGGLVSLRLLQRVRSASRHEPLDPEVEQQINYAANEWATAHGHPAAAPLVAGKLRLAYVLTRRKKGRRRRWSR